MTSSKNINLQCIEKLGVGTIWMGRRWPADNKNYISPTKEEIERYLLSAYGAGIRTFDTAAAYGNAEMALGIFLKEHADVLPHLFISTKWGEEFDAATEKSFVDHSVERLHFSFKRSLGYLPKIDLLYIHKANVKVLENESVKREMLKLKEQGKIKFTGVSISDEKELDEVLKSNRYWFDYIQTAADVAMRRLDLLEKANNAGLKVVVNSPIRKNANCSPKQAFENLANNKYISCILTGTRTHLAETIAYF